jgi:DNA polymerase-3 subunit alpha
MTRPFVHLRGLSTYSMLDGLGTPKAILTRAKDLEMSHIAITDLYGMYGAVDMYTKAKDTGVAPIV